MNTDDLNLQKSTPHHHADEYGRLVQCYHKCKSVLTSTGFWVGMTLGFPLEHGLYHYVPPFTYIGRWMGLAPH